jgi:hypothetical protein
LVNESPFFSDETSAKLICLGHKKENIVLDNGLAGNDDYYQITNQIQDNLAFEDALFDGIGNASATPNDTYGEFISSQRDNFIYESSRRALKI